MDVLIEERFESDGTKAAARVLLHDDGEIEFEIDEPTYMTNAVYMSPEQAARFGRALLKAAGEGEPL